MKTLTLNDENFDSTINNASTPVLVDFWADWCGPCKMLAPVLEEIASEQAGRTVVAKVNVDESPELAARYNITGIPTLLYFSSGELRAVSTGVAGKKVILNQLEKLTAQPSATQPA